MQLIYHSYHKANKFNESFLKWLLIPYIILSLSHINQAALEIVKTAKRASKISTSLSGTKALEFIDGGEEQHISNARKTIFKQKVRQATEPLQSMQESFSNDIQTLSWLPNTASERVSDVPIWRNGHWNRSYNKNSYPELNYNKNYNNYETVQNLAAFHKESYPSKQRQQEQQTALLPTSYPPETTISEPTHVSLLSQLIILWEFHQTCMTIWNAIVEYKQTSAPEITTTELAPVEQSANKIKVKRGNSEESKTISTGRYIKNDPLKSYYDFVIIEASHKFWSVFEVITSVIIIYSTFTAIYFSKMNPLVSKYDYTDYLGSENYIGPPEIEVKPDEARDADDEVEADLDFIDVDDANDDEQATYSHNWLPNTGHSLKFILDAIDKLPVDHGSY